MLRGDVDARFGDFRLHSRIALDGGGVHAVFGPSGCGKSLLLRWLAGLIRPRGASLAYADEIWQQGRYALPPHRRGLGYVAQQAALFPHLSVRQNLEYGYRRSAERRVAPEAVIAALGLEPLFDRPVHGLSGGQRQRLAIGRALLCSPRLLLLDEPLSALDRPARLGILRDLRRVHGALGVPMLYVSHSAEEIERLADRVMLMRAGTLAAGRDLAELAADSTAPLDPEGGAVNLLEADPVGFDPADALAELDCSDIRLRLPAPARIDGRIRLRVAAREVGVSLSPPADASFQNVLPAVVEAIEPAGAGLCIVRCGTTSGLRLNAELTLRSQRSLALRPGLEVYLLVKSAALLD